MFNIDLTRHRIVDLSFEVVPGAIEDRPFDMTVGELQDRTYRFDIHRTHTHVGTHVESPWHFYGAGRTIADFPPESFMGRAVLLPFRLPAGDMHLSPAYCEAEIGALVRPGDCVLFHNAHNAGIRQGHFVADDVPYMSVDTARWLRDRKIKLFGFDMLRMGCSMDETRAIHDVLMREDICIVEWLDHLGELGTREFYFMALPYLVKGIDSSFARAIAII